MVDDLRRFLQDIADSLYQQYQGQTVGTREVEDAIATAITDADYRIGLKPTYKALRRLGVIINDEPNKPSAGVFHIEQVQISKQDAIAIKYGRSPTAYELRTRS